MIIKRQNKSNAGFTLIEVLVVIVIIGLIAAIATPSFNNWQLNAAVSADMRRLYGFFQKARIEAVKRNATCTVVLTANTYQSTVGAEVIDSGAYSNGVTGTPFNRSYTSRGLINAATTVTLLATNGTQHALVINTRGRMRIQ